MQRLFTSPAYIEFFFFKTAYSSCQRVKSPIYHLDQIGMYINIALVNMCYSQQREEWMGTSQTESYLSRWASFLLPVNAIKLKRPNDLTPPPQCCSSLSVWFSIQYILLLLFYFSCLLMLSTGGYFQIAYLSMHVHLYRLYIFVPKDLFQHTCTNIHPKINHIINFLGFINFVPMNFMCQL